MSAAPVTLPSHSTIMTGTYPPWHGVRDNGIFSLPDSSVTLAELLAEAGYDTGAVIGSFPLDHKFGLAQGFDFYDDHVTASTENYRGDRLGLAPAVFFDERPAALVNEAILPWLRERGDRPFFAWIHLLGSTFPTHPPRAVQPDLQQRSLSRRARLHGPSTGRCVERARNARHGGSNPDRSGRRPRRKGAANIKNRHTRSSPTTAPCGCR